MLFRLGDAVGFVLLSIFVAAMGYKVFGWLGPMFVIGIYVVGTIINLIPTAKKIYREEMEKVNISPQPKSGSS